MLDRNCLHKNKLEWTAWGISLTYSKNRRGSKIDPWGTTQEILDKSEKWMFMLTVYARFDKCNLNHATVFSEKPIVCNLPRRISWFIVSKDFWRSISIIPVKIPLSKPFSILSLRKERQRSVEWFFLNSDWSLYKILFWSKKLSTWSYTILSITFDINGKREMGVKFSGVVLDPFLYNAFCYLAILQSLGKSPEEWRYFIFLL